MFIPVVNEAISDAALSGSAATVADLIPLFASLLLLVAMAGPLMRRV